MKTAYISEPINITNYDYTDKENIFNYIVCKEELQHMLNIISNDLRHPVTVINVNYEDVDEQDLLYNCRVDSVSSIYALRNNCRNLMTVAGEYFCLKCDYHHAQYCKEIFSNEEKEIESLLYFSKKYNKPIIETNKKYNVKYMIYDCPMLGYCEICFPIFFNGTIIGVFFVGEILLEEKDELISQIRSNFLDNNEILLKDYCENMVKKERYSNYEEALNDVKYYIENEWSDRKCLLDNIDADACTFDKINFQDRIDSINKNKLIDKCSKHIKKLENDLKDLWTKKQHFFYQKKTKEIEALFEDKYKEIRCLRHITYNEIRSLFDTLNYSILSLKNSFNFDYCRIYQNLPIMKGEQFLSSDVDLGLCEYFDLRCDFDKINLNNFSLRNSLDDIEDNPIKCFSYYLNNGELGHLSGEKEVAIACENLIVLFGISSIKNSMNTTNINSIHLKTLFEEIGISFQRICTYIENISAIFMQQQHQRTLRMYRHECTHLAKRIQQDNMYYYNRNIYNMLTEEKKKNIFKDINSIAILLQHLSTNIGIIVGSVNQYNLAPNFRFIDIRNELNKWRAMFRLELAKKNIRLFNATNKQYEGSLVYSHEELLCLLLYNLIDNAVKYSYWGTNIIAEIKEGAHGSKIIIEDFGMEIENNRHPYDLFYRSKIAQNTRIGDGIGLYSADRIAEILGLEVNHICNKISDFNLPLVKEALKRNLTFEGLEEAKKELKNISDGILIDDNYYEDKHYARLPDKRILTELYKPMYHVKFTIDNFNFTLKKG